VITDYSDERKMWLNDLNSFCTKNGILLIFDEVITGFRWPKYSVAASWGIIPDLLCIGKSMGNGWPISAVLGKQNVMDGPFFISSTFAGETGSLIATDTVCRLLYSKAYDVDKLWEEAEKLVDKINSIPGIGVRFAGYPTRGVLAGEPLDVALFMQEMCRQGVLVHKSWFINWHILDQKDIILSAIHNYKVAREIGEVKLLGKMPTTPFAAVVRQH
jgi:glutamate-1-semialdehyde 2,1-aminomutase